MSAHQLLVLCELMLQVWKVITKLPNAGQYIGCVDCWIDFVLKCFGHRELNTVLADIIKV